VKKVLVEAALVAITGGALAFLTNSLSSRGLKLTRNYFPGANRPSLTARAATNPAGGSGTTNIATASAEQEAIARLRGKGFQVADGEQALSLFHDARYEQGLIIFVDARNDDHYKHGHIPGAYQFDHMYPEKYLGSVLTACNTAQQVVVYCDGGDCELSEFAAEFLRGSAGIPNDKLFVYSGGLKEWEKRHLPLEIGERKSGQFRTASK